MTTTTSRRAVLAGAAAMPALAVPAIAQAAEPDPIFAAIEAHKAAYIAHAVTGRIYARTNTDEADAVDSVNREALEDAEMGLLEAVPTTMAGVLALLDYCHDFNRGALRLDGGSLENWASSYEMWPDGYEFYDDSDLPPFAWGLIENVHAALRAIAARGAQS